MSSPFESEISIEFDSPIWEVQAAHGRLLITTRDKEELKTQFSLFDLGQNEFIFSNLSFEEDWWVSLYQFSGDFAVFQHYDDTQDIEKRTAFCLDCSSQEVIWSIEEVKLQQVNESVISCEKLDSQEKFLVDIATGEKIETSDLPKAKEQGIYPLQYQSDSPHYSLLEEFVKRDRSNLTGSVDYLEYKNWIFISGNFEQENTYSLFLFVYDSEGVLVEEIELESDLTGQAIGTFFILDQALIFVEKKHLMHIRRLS